MSTVLAIDPGPTESAYALIDAATRRPMDVNKVPNLTLRDKLINERSMTEDHAVAIEMIASYGMSVGHEVFETCVWIGRFYEACGARINVGGITGITEAMLVFRKDVKMHHCHSAAAKDSNITQALRDRFAHGQTNYGKGTKAEPGWFHGFSADMWQAYALAVLVADRLQEGTE
jgi:hypothetical protein